jgi:predicted DNA binding CopG/RHH family protein
MNNKCNETLNIRITKELLDDLRKLASKQGITYSQLIRDVLKDYCDSKKLEHIIWHNISYII